MRNKGVCFQPDRLRLPLLLWQLCLFHRPHYEAFCLSFSPVPHPRSLPHIFFSLSISVTGPDLWLPPLFLCRSIYCPDWQVITSQVTAAYSRSWEVIKVFFWCRVFQDLLKFSEPDSPCEAVPGGDSAELLVLSLCVWYCQCCSHPHPLEPCLILWLRGGWGKGLVSLS